MTWEFKLEPTPEQAAQIEQILAVCRQVWNFALRERKDWLNSRKPPINACSIMQEYILPADEPYPSYHTQAKRLTLEAYQINVKICRLYSYRLYSYTKVVRIAFRQLPKS